MQQLFFLEEYKEILQKNNIKNSTAELIVWYEGKPQKEASYLVQLSNGDIMISYFYQNGKIFRCEIDDGLENPVIRYAEMPQGKLMN